MGETHGDLTLRVDGRAHGQRVEIIKPTGLDQTFSAADLTSEIKNMAQQLRGEDHALFLMKFYPPEDGERWSRHRIELLKAPEYAEQ